MGFFKKNTVGYTNLLRFSDYLLLLVLIAIMESGTGNERIGNLNQIAPNAIFPLEVQSEYPNKAGESEVLHPDVLYIANRWNGYKYWMVYTPYPDNNHEMENPCISVSNDNVHWSDFPGATNPLDEFQTDYTSYNSDPDLVLSSDGKTMYCLWRRGTGNWLESILYKSSMDGKNWSTSKVIYSHRTDNFVNLISPSCVFSNGKYRLWYVCKGNDVYPRKVMYMEANIISGPWSLPEETNIRPFEYDVAHQPTKETWHINVTYHKGMFWMINDVGNYNFTGAGNLYLGRSKDGIHWKFGAKPVMSGSAGWDRNLYRASILPVNQMSDNFKIWYSTERTGNSSARIAYTETTSYPPKNEYICGFTVSVAAQNTVHYMFTGNHEDKLKSYTIYRGTSDRLSGLEQVSEAIRSSGSHQKVTRFFTDTNADGSGTYYYWVKCTDKMGDSEYNGPVSCTFSEPERLFPPKVPLQAYFNQLYPNPFQDRLMISYGIPHDQQVSIEVHNLKGELVKNILDTHQKAGQYRLEWNGDGNKGKLKSGVYTITVNTPGYFASREAYLLRY